MYLVINLTVVDMFVGGSSTFAIVLLVLLYGCEAEKIYLLWPKWSPVLFVLAMKDVWLPLPSVAGIAVISLERMHATFRPFRHRNIQKWAYGVIIAGVWILTAMTLIPYPLTSLYMGTCIDSGNWYFLYTSGYHIVAFAFLLSVFLTPPLL